MGGGMSIEFRTGDIFESGADVLVNPVNCRGISGAGLALEFKRRFPIPQKVYERLCAEGQMHLGDFYMHARLPGASPQYIVYFPTKVHPKDRSNSTEIRDGLEALCVEIDEMGGDPSENRAPMAGSIAVPALGCGLGGLDWADVKPLIEAVATRCPQVHWIIYEPLERHASARAGDRPARDGRSLQPVL